ncbi:hypothetical protein [Croceibacterium ferulae]|uniref:hypothetical protein n=1 Tax=Croceibacterium ferulae TaxID=1854641 RepID=UPI001F4DBEBC|nr:hypothetical protein [Croceibacterium ferulae]
MPAGSDWTSAEIDGIVVDYFAMLAEELAGRSFSKAQHRRALQGRIDRSEDSIEFKHQNISAVMLGLGQPWINGYKPAANFQSAFGRWRVALAERAHRLAGAQGGKGRAVRRGRQRRAVADRPADDAA